MLSVQAYGRNTAELENMLLYLVSAGRWKYASCLSHYLEAMNILKAFKMEISLDVEQKLSPMVSGET